MKPKYSSLDPDVSVCKADTGPGQPEEASYRAFHFLSIALAAILLQAPPQKTIGGPCQAGQVEEESRTDKSLTGPGDREKTPLKKV